MIHTDWAAWDRWMETHDHLVQKGFVPTCEEITRANDLKADPPSDRDHNVAATRKFEHDCAILEQSKLTEK